MEIEDFIGEYPSRDSTKFQYEIARKKEFQDLKLDRHEPKPSIKTAKGANFKHQVIIQRFLSGKTDYDQLLLFHGLGSGKTRSSILVAEINQSSNKPKALILVKNKLLRNNYRGELAFYDDKYLPKDDKGRIIDPVIESERYKNIITRRTGVNYDFETFQKFSKYISTKSDQQLKNLYSNRVIIIDEAHNLRIKTGKEALESKTIYKNFHRFLHAITNCKVLLLTGTPIWDTVEEISSLMNLLLPLDKQLDIKNFEHEYFDGFELKQEKAEIFAKELSGRISYVRESQSNVVKDFQGDTGSWTARTKIVFNEMSKFQYNATIQAKQDISAKESKKQKKKGGAFRQFELEASNFSYAYEGANYYGKKFSTKFVKKTLNRNIWTLDKTIASDIKDNLKQYSSKFYNTIQEILAHPNESVFVYEHIVEGTGAILFGLILELFGFQRTSGKTGVLNEKKPRYAIITAETTSEKEVDDIIRAFNNPKNKHGEYIQVLIGSKKLSEGVTLKNVLQTHVLTPYWHMSAIDQAIGRTVRFGSHDDLGEDVSHVRIFLHASSYKKERTVDIDTYIKAEDKDIKTRQVYRLLKRIAFDCPLTYKRSVNPFDKVHSRECDYDECNFECIQMKHTGETGGVYDYDIPKENIDATNYNLYYSQDDIKYIIQYLEYLFKFSYTLTLSDVSKYIPKMSEILVLRALEYIINSKLVVLDKYGFPAFLKEYKNIYFLDPNLSTSEFDHRNLYYLKTPIIREKVSMEDVIDIMRIKSDKDRIEYFCNQLDRKDKKEVAAQFDGLDHKVQIIALESAYIISRKDPANRFAKIIVDHMASFLYTVSNEDVAKAIFDRFERISKKDRNIKANLEQFEKVILYLNPDQASLLPKLKKYIKEKNDKKIKSTIATLRESTIENVKDDEVIVHVLFNIELEGTSYKRILKATGLTRCYSEDEQEWKFCPSFIEQAYIDHIREIDEASKMRGQRDNKYGVYGTIDKTDQFRIVEIKKKGRGIICEKMSDKPRLIRLILEVRDKEKELDGKITLNPKISTNIQSFSKEELIRAIEGNVGKDMDQFKVDLKEKSKEDLQVLDTLTTTEVKKLCHMLKKWLAKKKILYEE